MKALLDMAALAAQTKTQIRGRTYKRSSLLKPLDIILDLLEREPRSSMREVVCRAAEQQIFDHVYDTIEAHYRPGKEKQQLLREAIHEYVTLFFQGILGSAYKSDVNRLVRNKRMLRSAYLISYRAALSTPEDKGQFDSEQDEEATEHTEQNDEE